MTKYCFALDLKDDEKLICEYRKTHQKIWPEITKSILDAGILNLEIFNVHNRLFMIMQVDTSFSFEEKDELDKNNVKVQEWEAFMWKYQQALPMAKKGEKWGLMEKIYQL